jgi:hypothetical protein
MARPAIVVTDDARRGAGSSDGHAAGMAPLPERTVGPALLLCVIFAQRAAIGGKLTLKHQAVARQPARVAAAQPVGDGVGGKDAGAQCFDDAVARNRIAAQSSVTYTQQRELARAAKESRAGRRDHRATKYRAEVRDPLHVFGLGEKPHKAAPGRQFKWPHHRSGIEKRHGSRHP